jgi:methionyl-tRNA synthetase
MRRSPPTSIARFQRAQGRDVRFQTGTDEHGLKMAQAARAKASSRAHLRQNVASFPEMCDTLNVSYDRFIRTSKPDHYRASQAIWKAMEERGDLTSTATRVGTRSATRPITSEELTDGEDGEKLSPQGRRSNGRSRKAGSSAVEVPAALLDHYAANPDFIRPKAAATRCSASSKAAEGPQHLAHQLRLGRAGAGSTATSCTSGSMR